MKSTPLLAVCFTFALLGEVSLGADPAAPAQPLGAKGQLVFSDDFERTDLGPALRSPIPAFTIADGLLQGRQMRANHGGTLLAALPLPDGNVILEIKFRFAGARSFNVACDDIKYQGTHAGHISRVTVQPNRITLHDDKEGVMRNDIYALLQSADPQKKAEGKHLAEKATREVPVKLATGRWYRLGLEIVGDRMRVTLDDELVGELQSPGLRHATKPNLRFSAWGKEPALAVQFDDLRVWAVRALEAH